MLKETITNESAHGNAASSNESNDQRGSDNLYSNFIIFSVCFAVVHASVDAVLAFASAELGDSTGSYAG